MKRWRRRLYSLEARGRNKGDKWWLAHSCFSYVKTKQIQKALAQNFLEPHDFRIKAWDH